jgi:3-oxoacyl-[acyl-carrier-protein] synthase III
MMNRQPAATIAGLGHFLPERVVTNEQLPPSLHCDPVAIRKKTGISERRWVAGRVYTSDLGALAARAALQDAGIRPQDVDCIIATTQSPDYVIPGIGVLIQAKLDLAGIPCFDLRNQCSGFVYALQAARAFITTGEYRCILIVCAELQSHCLGRTPMHAHMAPLFGDGAGAAVVAAGPLGAAHQYRMPWIKVYADGRGAGKLRQRVFDISLDPFVDLDQLGEEEKLKAIFGEMDGEHVFRNAVRMMSRVVSECLSATGFSLQDIAFLAPHQANASICSTVASIVGMPSERVLMNISRVGNTSSASIPILLSEQRERFSAGNRILCSVFGAGYTWGGVLLEVRDER